MSQQMPPVKDWLSEEALEKARKRQQRSHYIQAVIVPWWSYVLILVMALGLIGGTLISMAIRPEPTVEPTLSITPTNPYLPGGMLRTNGTQIVTDTGKPVVLRGISMDNFYDEYSRESRPDQEAFEPTVLSYATQEDIQMLADSGVNVIRLGLHWRWIENRLMLDLVDQYIEWCKEAGIYIILDMQLVPPHRYSYEQEIWGNFEAQGRYKEFWRVLVREYRSEVTIAGYDIYNRPDPPDEDQWWELAQETIEVIRAEDPYHLIFVEKPVAEGASFRLLEGGNIVYTFRDYEPYSVTHAAVQWSGDSRLPVAPYPGTALVGMKSLGQSEVPLYDSPVGNRWFDWAVGPLEPPEDADWGSIVLFAEGIQDVAFDEILLYENNISLQLSNLDFELSNKDGLERPFGWYFVQDGEYAGVYNYEYAIPEYQSRYEDSNYGIGIVGEGTHAEWYQGQWIKTEEYFPALESAEYNLQVLFNPVDYSGTIGATIEWYQEETQYFNEDVLRAIVDEQLAWAQANHVPLFISDFGATRFAPNQAKYRILRDRIAIYNEYRLGWTVWNYRETPAKYGFALYEGLIDEPAMSGHLDQYMLNILQTGWAGGIPDY